MTIWDPSLFAYIWTAFLFVYLMWIVVKARTHSRDILSRTRATEVVATTSDSVAGIIQSLQTLSSRFEEESANLRTIDDRLKALEGDRDRAAQNIKRRDVSNRIPRVGAGANHRRPSRV